MQPRLVKVQIPKDTLVRRAAVERWLVERSTPDLLWEPRCTADAFRVAVAYVMRDWQRWSDTEGNVYKAIAASPTKQQGVMLDINVQVRTPTGVQYTTTVCKLRCQDDGLPRREAVQCPPGFPDLWEALAPDRLLSLGTMHLFDQDLRRLCGALLDDTADTLWPGVWLCLKESPGVEAITQLGLLVVKGQVAVKTLTLEQSDANRHLLAEELATEYTKTLEHLTKRLGYPKPNIEGIEQDYLQLCTRIVTAQETLGVAIPILEAQCEFEELLASTPA